MPNPALSQANFDLALWRWLDPIACWRRLRQIHEWLTRDKIRIVEVNAGGAPLSAWAFTAFNHRFLTKGPRLYVRVTDENPGAGSALVSVYRTTGAASGDKVCEGSAANGNTATLAATNSSGISMTVLLGTVGASVAADNHYLVVYPDVPKRALAVFDGTEDTDADLRAEYNEARLEAAQSVLAAMESFLRFSMLVLTAYLANKVGVNPTIAAAFLVRHTQNSEGLVTVEFSGLVRELQLVMASNTTAQTILRRAFSAPTATGESDNRGKLTWGTITPSVGARPGTYTAECSSGGATVFGDEEIKISFVPLLPGGRRMNELPLTATKRMKVGSSFRSPEIGIESVTVQRDVTKSGDGSNVEFAAADITVSGENTENTSSGVVYGKVTGAGPYTVSFYKASGAAAADLVAQVTGISAGGAYTAVAQNDSGLTVVGTLGSAPAAAEVTFDLNGLESDSNDGAHPDRWYFTLAAASTESQIAKTLGEMYGVAARLNDTAGTPTIEADRIQVGEDVLLTEAS